MKIYTRPKRVPPHTPAAVERTFGWFMPIAGMQRDYETLPERSITMIHGSMIDNMDKVLTGEPTQPGEPIPPQRDALAPAQVRRHLAGRAPHGLSR